MAEQAEKIGKKLIEYVRNVTDVTYDPAYVVRSPCEGHLLKPHVSLLMFGPRSLRHLMQIYNEYLHQIVLLRDALLPFENFEDVIIPITAEPGRKRGMRHTEEVRANFLAEMMMKQVTQRSIINSARFLLAPELPSGNVIGFQYEYGTILPSFIAGGSSGRLLRYVPAVVDPRSIRVAFHNEVLDYYTAPRIEFPSEQSLASSEAVGTPRASLIPVSEGDSASLELSLEDRDGTQAAVDVGQSARGYRYANFIRAPKTSTSTTDETIEGVQSHSAWSVLTRSGSGLVLPAKGIHLIQARSKIELYALLGKIYPDNVVVIEEGRSLSHALEAAGGFADAGRVIIEVRA
jgi:hypothetical protein